MAIGLTLKTDVAIGRHTVTILDEKHQPLKGIPKEERQIEQFALLSHVNELVIQLVCIQSVGRQDQFAQCDGQEIAAKRDSLYLHYLGLHASI